MTKPHLFLDMDGVQADFFGAWAKKHGVPTYKEIPNRENDIEELAKSSEKKVYDFFFQLEMLPGGLVLIEYLKRNNISYTILSAPLRGVFSHVSIQAKKDWLDKYHPGTSNTAIFTSKKFNYAFTDGKANVLVDDFGPYLEKWSGAGGISVKHEDENTDTTIRLLDNIYQI